jgi:hypothetical protein
MRNSSYKQTKDKQKKLRSIKLATKDVMRLRKPELHNDARKKERSATVAKTTKV